MTPLHNEVSLKEFTMTRRRLIAGAVLLLAPMAAGARAQQFETIQLGDGVYQFRFEAHRGLFVVTESSVVVVDPISAAAAAHLADAIKQIAPSRRLRAIVYSHDHGDHATGAPVLQRALSADAPIIAHERARAKLVSRTSDALPPPDITFGETLTLWLDGRPLELHYLGKSHSDNMVVAYLPEQKIAFAVDFVTNDGVGYRDLPDYHFSDFFESLQRLLALDFTTIAFGHGVPGDRATIERQIRYYDQLRGAVATAIANGLSEDEAAQQVRLPAYEDWRGYREWFPLNVRAMYRWLATERPEPAL